MSKATLQSLHETVVSKFISLYKAIYKVGDKTKEYDFVSRNLHMSANPDLLNQPYKSNAVTIFV